VLALIVLIPGAALKYHLDFHTANTPVGWLKAIQGIPAEWKWTIYDLEMKR
jgi:hypothetical protein